MNYRVCALISSLWVVSIVAVEAAPKAPALKKPAAPVWKPVPALLRQLAAPVTIGKFQVRPPKGYVLQNQPGPNGAQAMGWVGPARDNGVKPYLMLTIVNLPTAQAKKYSAEQILDKFLQGIQRSRGEDWKRTPTERGTVNGQPFVRARWSGTSPENFVKLHGFNYVALVDGQVIQLSSQDVEPGQRAPLELAEAAALTFKRATK